MANYSQESSEKVVSDQQIVIIEPDEVLSDILAKALEEKNYQVQVFTKGQDARKYILDQQNDKIFSLIILECLLPDIDGFKLLDDIVAEFKHQVPVLITSILSSESDVLTGIHDGAVDYMTKPISLPIFIAKVESVINFFPRNPLN